jgi:outer membrane biosynthesis protein TonB
MPSSAKSVSTDSPVERRSYGRRRIDAVTYLDLGADNGAILVNLSEGGVGFQSVAPLELGQTVILKFKLPGGKKHLESRAEVAWSNESGKRGGLRFVELSADARAQIRAGTDDELAAEAAPEIHRAETSGDSIPAEKRNSPEGSQPSPMGEIRGPRSTPRANTPPEAPTRVASARAALPVRSEIHNTAPAVDAAPWIWREPYFAALREQNPFSLRERLLTAEKAILFRMEVLHGAPDDLPELQALREALDSLYSRQPKKSFGPPRIVEEQGEYEWGQRNWTTLGAVVALAVIVSLATGWILGSKNSGNETQSIGTATEPKERITNSNNEFASVRDVHIPDTPPQELHTPPKDNGASTPLTNTPGHPSDDDPPNDAKDLPAQQEDGEGFIDTSSGKDQGTPSVKGQIRDTASRSLPSTTEGRPSWPAGEPPSRPFQSLPAEPKRGGTISHESSDQPKEAPEVRAEPQAGPLPSIGNQAKTTDVQGIPPAAQEPISQGSVTISFSTYPSLRIPPQLRSQAVRAELKIGQVVSRIDPIYPEDAERQRIEGTVNLHAIIGTDGSVKGLEGISGPPLLVPAAASAVRHWRCQPTLLSDQPIETGRDVTIVFRLSRDAASEN